MNKKRSTSGVLQPIYILT